MMSSETRQPPTGSRKGYIWPPAMAARATMDVRASVRWCHACTKYLEENIKWKVEGDKEGGKKIEK